jgi:hypothetical protein
MFSQGGITITKHRNRLKGDIVEALQCMKCMVRHELLFREAAPSSILEAELNGNSEDSDIEGEVREDDGRESEGGWESWDELLMEDEEEGRSTAAPVDTISDSD